MQIDGNASEDAPRERTLVLWGTHANVEPVSSTGAPPTGYQMGECLHDSGQVYEAHHPRMADPFVIKLFWWAAGEGAEGLEAFSREAGRVSIMRHPHIAQVLDSGVLGGRTPFVAMARLTGETLETRIARGSLPISDVLPVVRGVVLALSAAHAAGIVHREIRPDNVFLADLGDGGLGFVKVLDFGVSQLTWGKRAAGRSVDVGFGAGAIPYLAPEQATGDLTAVDARADQFAVAMLAYRLLSGSEAPAGDAVVAGKFPSAGHGFAADAVLTKALSQRPDDRFPSVGLFFKAFEAALSAALSAAPITDLQAPVSGERRNPLSRRKPINRGRNLSKQFFEEGERQQDSQWENSPLAVDPGVADHGATFSSFDRVPRRRGPLVAAALIVAVAVAGFAARGPILRSARALRDSKTRMTILLSGADRAPASANAEVDLATPAIADQSAPAMVPQAMAPQMKLTVAPEVPPSVAAPSPILFPAIDVSITGRALAPSNEPTRRHHRHHGAAARSREKRAAALKGYVWSPDAEQLVSSESVSPPVEAPPAEPDVEESAEP
jgi:serine/threonine protein kinase